MMNGKGPWPFRQTPTNICEMRADGVRMCSGMTTVRPEAEGTVAAGQPPVKLGTRSFDENAPGGGRASSGSAGGGGARGGAGAGAGCEQEQRHRDGGRPQTPSASGSRSGHRASSLAQATAVWRVLVVRRRWRMRGMRGGTEGAVRSRSFEMMNLSFVLCARKFA